MEYYLKSPMRIAFISICTAVFLLMGCHGSSPRSRIAAIPPNTTEAVYVSEHAGLAREAAAHHLSVYWNGPNGDADISRQVALVQRAIRDHDYGIVLSPSAPFALDAAVQSALDHHIPVVILGPPLHVPADPGLSYVSNDIVRAVELAAQRIHSIVGDEGEVAIVGIDPKNPGRADYARSFEEALSREAPRVNIVSRLIGTFSWEQSEREVAQTLEEHPKIAAIYALTLDDVRGSVSAVHAEGHDGRTKVVGINQGLDLLFDVRHGLVDSLVIPDMPGMGQQAVRNLVAAHDGRSVATSTVFEPVLLTRANIDTEAMQQRLKLDWRPQP
jgi:ribose transport system substrate-binding protein